MIETQALEVDVESEVEIQQVPENPVGYVRPRLYPKQLRALFNTKLIGCCEASTKSGKSQPLGSLVYTPTGPKEMGDIAVGDAVLTPSGRHANVLAIYPQGVEKVYRVTFSDGTSAVASGDHLWAVEYYGEESLLTTRELQALPDYKRNRTWLRVTERQQFTEQPVPLDPYLVGVAISEGGLTADFRISTGDEYMVNKVSSVLEDGYQLKYLSNVDYAVRRPKGEQGHKYIDALRELGLHGKYSYEKFIPDVYKYNTVGVRLNVLRGIMDGDGWVNKLGHARLEQTSERLALDVREVVESLGGNTTITVKDTGFQPCYRQRIKLKDPSELFTLPRKMLACKPMVKDAKKILEKIEYVGDEETQCIRIDDYESLYLTDNFCATHNTHAAIVWLSEQAVLYGGRNMNFWWVAPVSDQTDIAFRRICLALPKDSFTKNLTRKTITLNHNGATIWFKSGDAPDCYDDKTEVLTDGGWKLFADLDRDEMVLTYNPIEKMAEWKLPDGYVEQEYSGKMYKVGSKKLDLMVTPNHKFWVEHLENTRSKIARMATLDEVDVRHEAIPATAGWRGEYADISHDDAALMGIYLAEGCASGCSGGTAAIANGDYLIHITQSLGEKGGSKGNVRDEIIALLTRMGYKVNVKRDDGVFVRSKDLWGKFVGLGDRYTKRIPKEYKELSPDKLRTLMHWMLLGDGTIRRGDGLDGECTYYSCNKGLVDDFQEIAIKAGFSSVVRKKEQNVTYIKGRKIKSGDMWQASLVPAKRNHLHSTEHGSYISEVDYSGKGYCLTVDNHIIMVRRNGKPCWSGNSLFGEDVYAAIVDEASRVKEESWQALWSTLTATQGPVRIIGNVKGRANWMYRLARVAKSGDPDMHYEKITCMDAVAAGVITQESVDRARKLLPEDVFKELYLAEAGEDGGNPFGIGHIYRAINPEGLSLKTPVAWGWDVAKHQNWTVGVGLDDDGAVCRFMRFQDMWEPTLERITKATVKVPALIDSTGSGDQVLERLRTQGHTNFEGQLFGGWKAKYELMLGLAVAIQNADVSYPAGRIVEELEAFEYEDKGDMVLYTSPKGVHDDCVDALAMAVKRKMTLDTRSYITDAIPLSFEQTSGWMIR